MLRDARPQAGVLLSMRVVLDSASPPHPEERAPPSSRRMGGACLEGWAAARFIPRGSTQSVGTLWLILSGGTGFPTFVVQRKTRRRSPRECHLLLALRRRVTQHLQLKPRAAL